MAEAHAELQSTHETANTMHPSPNYVLVFVWLIIITATEVGVGYIPPEVIPHAITYPLLLVMAGTKALLVALYFMHLRYDSKWFMAVLLVAMPLAVLFIMAMVLGFVRK